MDRAYSAATQDVPSAEPVQCLRTHAVQPRGRQATGTHLLVTFLCEQKSDSRAGRREKRLTSLAMANTKKATDGSPARRLANLATASKHREVTGPAPTESYA